MEKYKRKDSTMEECMRDCMRKLALWYTRTFKPIMSHDELEPIMSTMGFVGLPPSAPNGGWKEYVFCAPAGACRFGFSSAAAAEQFIPLPRPKLPYPKIDGLHIYTYRAFIDAVNFYVHMRDISDLFHIRGMPLHRVHDQRRKWRRMEEEESIFVYREGTLDQATYNAYHFNKQSNNGSCIGYHSMVIRDRGNNMTVPCLVSLEDIILV